MPTPNEKFREARERITSLDNPDECLTRQELADQANAWLWKRRKKEFMLTGNYIGKLEQGVIRWPSAVYREAFRAILGVPTDSELGFINARSRRTAVKLDDVKRRNLFETTTVGMGTLALGEPMAALLEDEEPTPLPRRIGATDIEHIRAAKEVFQSWSFTYGGELARHAALAELRYWAMILDESICPEQLRPALLSAVGDLADTAGSMAFDAGAHQQARRVFRYALACAEQAKDWPLRAEVLSDMSAQEIWTGQPDEGLTLVELALARPDRLTATILAMLHTDRASALAKLHRVQETLRAIGTADEHFAHSSPDNDPPFMAFYNADVHASHTGRRLAELAILGADPGEATNRLTAAATGHTKGYVRSRTMCLAKLATLTMVTGDPLQAVAIGNEALEVAGTLRSRLAAENLRELSRYAAPHQNLEEVAHLRHRIGALLVPTTDSP